MTINLGLLGAAYQGYAQDAQRQADEARRVKADARADQDESFQQEGRARQRIEWSEADRQRNADKADVAAVNAQFAAQAQPDASAGDLALAKQQVSDDQTQAQLQATVAPPADPTVDAPAAPTDSVVTGTTPAWVQQAPASPSVAASTPAAATSPVLDPAVSDKLQALAPPAGIPAPRNFNDTLAKQAELLRRKADRGDLKPQDYAQGMQTINLMRTEGVNDALKAFSAGDYQGGMAAFNQTGQHNGARVLGGIEGTTMINGQEVPTHIVTIANADGSRTVVDSAKAQYQLLDMNAQLAHVDRARQTNMQATQHADQMALGREQLKQSAIDAAASRGLQAAQLRLSQQQFDATTPLGRINSMSKALGQPLSSDQIENVLGVSKIPRAVELQVQSLMKENDTDSTAIAKAIASPEGMNPAASATFQKNAAIRNEKMNMLLAPYSNPGRATPAAGSDPLHLNAVLSKPAPAAPGGGAALQQPGGVGAAVSAAKAASAPPLGGATIPAPPPEKAWIGNKYVTTPEYQQWASQYGAAWQQSQNYATHLLDRARPN